MPLKMYQGDSGWHYQKRYPPRPSLHISSIKPKKPLLPTCFLHLHELLVCRLPFELQRYTKYFVRVREPVYAAIFEERYIAQHIQISP